MQLYYFVWNWLHWSIDHIYLLIALSSIHCIAVRVVMAESSLYEMWTWTSKALQPGSGLLLYEKAFKLYVICMNICFLLAEKWGTWHFFFEQREKLKKQLEKTKNQKEKLESLCRSLQAERKQNSTGSNSSDSSVPIWSLQVSSAWILKWILETLLQILIHVLFSNCGFMPVEW